MLVVTELPLYDEPFYSYNINLAGTSYHIKFIFNEQTQLYKMHIYTFDKEPIQLGLSVVPSFLFGKNLDYNEWKGGFYVECTAEQVNEYYISKPMQLSKYYRLLHCYDDEQE